MPIYIAKQSNDERGNNNRRVIVNHETGETVQMNLQNSFEKSAKGAQELMSHLLGVRDRIRETFFAVEEVKIGQEIIFQVLNEEELKKLAEGKIAMAPKKQEPLASQ